MRTQIKSGKRFERKAISVIIRRKSREDKKSREASSDQPEGPKCVNALTPNGQKLLRISSYISEINSNKLAKNIQIFRTKTLNKV